MKKTLFFSNIKGDIYSNKDNVSFNEYIIYGKLFSKKY